MWFVNGRDAGLAYRSWWTRPLRHSQQLKKALACMPAMFSASAKQQTTLSPSILGRSNRPDIRPFVSIAATPTAPATQRTNSTTGSNSRRASRPAATSVRNLHYRPTQQRQRPLHTGLIGANTKLHTTSIVHRYAHLPSPVGATVKRGKLGRTQPSLTLERSFAAAATTDQQRKDEGQPPPRPTQETSDNMSSDADYMAFLDKANEDPSKGYDAAQSQGGAAGDAAFKTTDKGVEVPQVLSKVTQGAFYTSDADEPFVPVALRFEGGELPNEGRVAFLALCTKHSPFPLHPCFPSPSLSECRLMAPVGLLLAQRNLPNS